jgi:hypothetical protein
MRNADIIAEIVATLEVIRQYRRWLLCERARLLAAL